MIGVNMAYHQALETENLGHPIIIIRRFIEDVKKLKKCLIFIMLVLGKERAKELGVLKKSLHNRERFGATPQVSKHILVKTPLAAGRFPAIAAASSPAFNSSKLLGERTWRFLEIIEWKKVFLGGTTRIQ